MSDPITIIGTPASPFVRKVLVCLEIKGLAYQVDPVVAFFTDDRLTELNPVRRIPVLIDGDVTLADSSVICEYLEDQYPENPVFPKNPADRARARWFDEYADTLLANVLLWRLFNQAVVKPSVWGEERNLKTIKDVIDNEIPPLLDYLERQLPREGYLFGDLGVADISLAVHFRNAAWARFEVDSERWPVTARYVSRVLNSPPFQKLAPFEDAQVKTPISQQRALLAEMGFPLTENSILVEGAPRQGPLTVRARN